jgi:hypothetical protein
VPSAIPADIVDDVYVRAQSLLMDIALEVTKRQHRSDGTTYGDSSLPRGDRIARFQDYATRGVLDYLKTVKPDLLERMVKQYQQDITESPLVRPRASSPAPTEPPMTGGY